MSSIIRVEKMASVRASSRVFSQQLKRESFSLQGLSRSLSILSLSSLNSLELEQRLKGDDVRYRSGELSEEAKTMNARQPADNACSGNGIE
ncbi:hypothetical protein R1flu_011621 [Riccia fluitans]|uniref:Uncharacterized protein n=1 Tax=Riccia fluitans TaxID=41844 RepID=A0ABD1Z9H1_9MARC